MTPRVYIETSVWGMTAPGQNPALANPTLQFMNQCENRTFVPCISYIVILEIQDAPQDVQDAVNKQMVRINPELLAMSAEVDALAQEFIDAGIVPSRRTDDAKHVACAMVHECDFLVSWNYRHIANVRKSKGFNAVAILFGLNAKLEIHTPLELCNDDDA